ncbi:MAG: DUF4397 domain-containing protein [Bacteroidota bacterium]
MKNLFKAAQLAVALLVLAYVLSGCIDGELPWDKKKNPAQPTAPAVADESYVSLYQTYPGLGDADVIVDGAVINKAPLSYGEKERYLRVGIGEKTLTLRVDGKDVAQQPITLDNEQQYSVFLVNNNSQPSFFVMPVANEPIKEGYVRIRFLNLSPDAPEANLVVDAGNQILFEGLSFQETSQYIEIPAQASYDLTVKSTAGNSNPRADARIETLPGMDLYDCDAWLSLQSCS